MYNISNFKLSHQEICSRSQQSYQLRKAIHTGRNKLERTQKTYNITTKMIYIMMLIFIISIAANIIISSLNRNDAVAQEVPAPNQVESENVVTINALDYKNLADERNYYKTKAEEALNLVEQMKIEQQQLQQQLSQFSSQSQTSEQYNLSTQLQNQLAGLYNLPFTRRSGTYFDGTYKYTYYSSEVKRHYRTDEWVLDANGLWHDTDGYFVVAADFVDYHKEPVIETTLGLAKVYDCGTGSNNIVDFYVNWEPE